MLDHRQSRGDISVGLAIPFSLGSRAEASTSRRKAALRIIRRSIITTMLDRIRVSGINLHAYLYEHMFAPWLPPTLGSHTYALAIVVLNIALLYPLYSRRIFLRI
jgi:predicted acyltransferase